MKYSETRFVHLYVLLVGVDLDVCDEMLKLPKIDLLLKPAR